MYIHEQIFSNIDHGRAWHNPAALFVTAPPELRRRVEAHYSQRAGHIPFSTSPGVIVENPSYIVKKQIAYLSEVIGIPLKIDSLTNSPKGTIIAPYVNTPETENSIKSSGHEVWGLPSKLVALAKNKANCHIELSNVDIPNFKVPEFAISEPQNIADAGHKLLNKIENIYDSAGMKNDYPLGLVIRGALSDGNYGAITLKEQSDGSILCVPDGNMDKKFVGKSWPEALQKAQGHFPISNDKTVDRRVVISRYMDIFSSPGMSIYLKNGEYESLDWNGQVQEPGSIACVGTSTYQPSNKIDKHAKELFERQTAEDLHNFTKHLCNKLNITINQVTGFINVDLMIPGPLEVELQKRRGETYHLYVAEINPRFTNWTDAIFLSLWAEKLDLTIANINKIIAQGLLTADKLPVTLDESSLTNLHEKVLEIDSKEKQRGNRVILRMADIPYSGFVFMGNTTQAKEATIQALRKL